VPSQTDDSPFITSIGERVGPHGVAVSRDMLSRWGGPLNYGDAIYIEGVGIKVVNDCMAERHRRAIDLWVETKEKESRVFHQFKNRKPRVWLIKTKEPL
jgi:hypothetical protein